VQIWEKIGKESHRNIGFGSRSADGMLENSLFPPFT